MGKLRISVTRQEKGIWIADSINLPGMPPVGKGKDELQAIGNLMVNLANSTSYNRKYYDIDIIFSDSE